ncbi:MAG: ThiF family adenylyltransferase, partial [[Ruminococcus] torques]
AYHSTIGRMKTDVMRERIKDIDPNIKVETYETFVLPDNAKELLEQIGTIHYIIDAIDTVSAKIVLAELAGERNIPIISSMGTGNKLHAEMFEITDLSKTSVCPLCKVMRKELRNRGITHLKVLYSKEKPISAEGRTTEEEKGMRRTIPGSVSFVPPVAGLLIAGEVIRSLIQAE